MKLTNSVKRDIEYEIVKQKIDPLRKAHSENVTNQTVAYITETLKPYKKIMDALPKDFLYSTDRVYMGFGDTYGERIDVRLPNAVIIPFSWKKGNSYTVVQITEDKWKKVFRSIHDNEIYMNKYESELRTEIRAVLAACTTSKRLIAVLPEIGNYISLSKLEIFPIACQPDKLKALLQQEA